MYDLMTIEEHKYALKMLSNTIREVIPELLRK